MFPFEYVQTSPYIRIQGNSVHTFLYARNSIRINDDSIRFLEFCRTPQKASDVLDSFDIDLAILESFVELELLVDSESIWQKTHVMAVEIEISAHCNWRCRFCPVSVDPKAKSTMEMDLFEEVLAKAEAHKSVQYVTFNSYNEPTLDIHFENRVKKLAKTRLKLALHTNGSLLNKAKVALLRETKVLEFVAFNLPTTREEDFRRMTQSSTFKKTLENIDHAVAEGLPVVFSVQGTREEKIRNIPFLKERYGDLVGDVPGSTSDRAGILENEYAQSIQLTGRLTGCMMPLRWIHVSVTGDIFICCEDYHQREVYAHINDGSLAEILESSGAVEIRRRVFGAEDAPSNYICRSCYRMRPSEPLQTGP